MCNISKSAVRQSTLADEPYILKRLTIRQRSLADSLGLRWGFETASKEYTMHIHGDHNTPAMSQRIFKIGLPVETVSIYLLCCGLADAGKDITAHNLYEIWNGTKGALDKGLKGLEEKNILIRIISDRQEHPVYKLTPDSNWRLN